ncbi:hypothetical protein B0H15DRAFT_796040 [Mycena belliarum]|uniref:Uncharacterized protein n=1 Tax=Mycena belliarum TaxID=1033014 RepID=A0AAD6XTX2_9AGAR|nr:hypothetical protein B0H15DRAFT_796040 [Mycena belliae]
MSRVSDQVAVVRCSLVVFFVVWCSRRRYAARRRLAIAIASEESVVEVCRGPKVRKPCAPVAHGAQVGRGLWWYSSCVALVCGGAGVGRESEIGAGGWFRGCCGLRGGRVGGLCDRFRRLWGHGWYLLWVCEERRSGDRVELSRHCVAGLGNRGCSFGKYGQCRVVGVVVVVSVTLCHSQSTMGAHNVRAAATRSAGESGCVKCKGKHNDGKKYYPTALVSSVTERRLTLPSFTHPIYHSPGICGESSSLVVQQLLEVLGSALEKSHSVTQTHCWYRVLVVCWLAKTQAESIEAVATTLLTVWEKRQGHQARRLEHKLYKRMRAKSDAEYIDDKWGTEADKAELLGRKLKPLAREVNNATKLLWAQNTTQEWEDEAELPQVHTPDAEPARKVDAKLEQGVKDEEEDSNEVVAIRVVSWGFPWELARAFGGEALESESEAPRGCINADVNAKAMLSPEQCCSRSVAAMVLPPSKGRWGAGRTENARQSRQYQSRMQCCWELTTKAKGMDTGGQSLAARTQSATPKSPLIQMATAMRDWCHWQVVDAPLGNRTKMTI